jgi:hypothetical protein
LKKVKILNQLLSDLQETGVSKLETAVSFYSLTPKNKLKSKDFFGMKFSLFC